MNLTKIKQLVKQNGDKFIFIENGEPDLVVMSFEEYERLTMGFGHPSLKGPRQEKVNQETEFVHSTIDQSLEDRVLPVRLENIRLEDLPL